MNKIRNAIIAAGVATGLVVLPSCSESAIEQEARVVGFGSGVDVTVTEPRWNTYEDEVNLPGGQIRDVRVEDEQVGCIEVDDDFFSYDMDDPDCWFDYSCVSTDYSHCEPVYESLYSYQRLEDTVVRQCIAPITKREYKADPVEDKSCEQEQTSTQSLHKTSRYILWVTTPNPDSETGGNLTSSIKVSAQEWQASDRSLPVVAVIKDGKITQVKVTG